MIQDVHARARQLMDNARVEGISASEQAWLEQHLEGCAECAQSAALTERAIEALRWVAVSADPVLAQATRQRVHLRALELAERQSRLLPVAVSCGLAALLSLVNLAYLWQGFAWLGEQWRLPTLAWQAGFVSAWFLPTSLAAVGLWMLSRTATNGNRETVHWAPSADARRGQP
jgi:uncharacterized membrane protein YqjE